MRIFGEKPFTSITVKVNQLCTPNRNLDLPDASMEIYLEDLISLIKIQSAGALEAARAIRKKIKYGNTPEELVLTLNLLELLVLNAGAKIGQTVASDEKLLGLLQNIVGGLALSGLGGPYDGSVVKRARELAYGWKFELQDLAGYLKMAGLYKSIPKTKASTHLRQASNFLELVSPVFGEELAHTVPKSPTTGRSRDLPQTQKMPAPPRPQTLSPYAMKSYLNHEDVHQKNASPKKGKHARKKKRLKGVLYADQQYRIPQINYKVEIPKIRTTIAECYTHTAALDNALLALPKSSNPMDEPKTATEFEKCRKIRRKVLRYLQYVGVGDTSHKSAEIVALDEEFLGSLIVANEQLVSSFRKFDKMCCFWPENSAQYNQNDCHDEESASSGESYYLSESEDEEMEENDEYIDNNEDLLDRGVDGLTVQEASSKLEAISSSGHIQETRSGSGISDQKKVASRPLQVNRRDTAVSMESGDPFGDKNEVAREKPIHY